MYMCSSAVRVISTRISSLFDAATIECRRRMGSDGGGDQYPKRFNVRTILTFLEVF